MFGLGDHPKLLRLRVLAEKLRRSLVRRSTGARSTVEHRQSFYDQVWREAAAELDATVSSLGYGVLEIRRGSTAARVWNNYTPLDDAVTLAIAGNKPQVFELLAKAGLPIPQHREFRLDDLTPADEFLATIGGDTVVKPARDTGAGHGVTTGVRTKKDLVRAAVAAAAVGEPLLVEQQIPGDVYRLFYLDGRLLDAVVRRSPTVVGDGHSTVRQLVEQVNTARATQGITFGQALLTIDLDMRQTLSRQRLSLDTVASRGQIVQIKTVNNENSADDNEPAAPLLCPAIVAAGAQAVAAVGARLAAVDLIAADPSVELERSGGVILEVNTTPGFYYHYHRRGEPAPVAETILERLLGTDSCATRPMVLSAIESASGMPGTFLEPTGAVL